MDTADRLATPQRVYSRSDITVPSESPRVRATGTAGTNSPVMSGE
jgi:hypothetical protein